MRFWNWEPFVEQAAKFQQPPRAVECVVGRVTLAQPHQTCESQTWQTGKTQTVRSGPPEASSQIAQRVA